MKAFSFVEKSALPKNYVPDYLVLMRGYPVCIVEAKSPDVSVRWTRMRSYRARFTGQGYYFQSWAGCIINIFGFDLRQAQPSGEVIVVGLTGLGPDILPLRVDGRP